VLDSVLILVEDLEWNGEKTCGDEVLGWRIEGDMRVRPFAHETLDRLRLTDLNIGREGE
jgi:hypothetical protein